MSDLSEKTTVVVGASRGLGRGIAAAFADAGAPVVAVARTGAALADLAASRGGAILTEVADATDPVAAAGILDRYDPQILVLVAGAIPVMLPRLLLQWERSEEHTSELQSRI